MNRKLLFLVLLLAMATAGLAQKKPKPQPPIAVGTNGVLQYTPDSLGNQVPDFSYCGYAASEKKIPSVGAIVFVPLPRAMLHLEYNLLLTIYRASLWIRMDLGELFN